MLVNGNYLILKYAEYIIKSTKREKNKGGIFKIPPLLYYIIVQVDLL